MAPAVQHIVHELPSQDVAFDIDAFDELIRSQGVRMIHYRAMRCPVGQTDINDNRRAHPDHEGCSLGYIFTKANIITPSFTGNSKQRSPFDAGFIDGSTANVTFPRMYDDGSAFYVAPFDRFYIDDPKLVAVTWQMFVHHESGTDRLKYPVVDVEDLIDNRGNRYEQGVDFNVVNGQLKWGTRRPAPDVDTGPGMGNGFGTDRGAVCSIRYRYQPYYYVGQIPHDLRITQAPGEDGARELKRMQVAVVLHREFVPLNKSNDQEEVGSPIDSDTLRQVLGPMNGGFGPR